MTATPVEPTMRPWEVHSGKVGPRHWERLAVVYVLGWHEISARSWSEGRFILIGW